SINPRDKTLIPSKMAKYFSQGDIELYKECFFFNCKRGYITQEDELARIMRSLNYSPTMEEVGKYIHKHSKSGGKMEFDSFLEAMHDHRETERCKEEILHGFIAQDTDRKGYVTANEARHVLSNFGERLSRHEVETLFKEGNVTGGQLRYKEFVNSVLTPAPDY
ncbi:hypothetical protein ACJMK2_024845, partial [Sinanodonta woodiana]